VYAAARVASTSQKNYPTGWGRAVARQARLRRIVEYPTKVMNHLFSRPRPVLASTALEVASQQLADQTPQERLRWASSTFGVDRVGLCTSFQIDGLAIVDMAWRLDPNVHVFTVDTGRLHEETCDVRKVRPLARALRGLDAWVTGLRRDQWVTRSAVGPIEVDHDHGGSSIGCAPCTRPIRAGESKRAGRWWWEMDAPKECGLHWPTQRSMVERP
jgi:phosphoadenosine phosphosulfate reductase